jgi:hypothetical protein
MPTIVKFDQATTASDFIENINLLQKDDAIQVVTIDGNCLKGNFIDIGKEIAEFYKRMPLRFQVDVASSMKYENYCWRLPIETEVSSVFREQKLWKS